MQAGNLHAKFDAIVLPQQREQQMLNGYPAGRMPPEYAGGLGASGVAALKAFVKDGGTLIALDSASMMLIDQMKWPVRNVLADLAGGGQQGAPGSASSEFYGPGSILRTEVETQNPIAFGRLSGWLLGGEKLNGKTAVAEVPAGKGRVILFGFRPQYRAQTWAKFKLLFNALYVATARHPAVSH